MFSYTDPALGSPGKEITLLKVKSGQSQIIFIQQKRKKKEKDNVLTLHNTIGLQSHAVKAEEICRPTILLQTCND